MPVYKKAAHVAAFSRKICIKFITVLILDVNQVNNLYNENMNIRQAFVGDLEVLINLGEQLYLVEKEFEPTTPYSKDEYRQQYTSQLNNPNALFLVAEAGNQVVGYAYMYIEDYPQLICKLEVVYIVPKFRQRGIGNTLVNKSIEWARQKKANHIRTDIFADNVASISLIEKNHFKPHNIEYSIDLI